MNASHVSVLQNNLINYASRVLGQAELSVENTTILSDAVKDINSTAIEVVDDLQVNLNALRTQPQNITAFQLLLTDLSQSLSEYSITTLYQEVQEMVVIQESLRQNLETALLRIQEQVHYLEYVNSLLPNDCL